MHGPTTDQFYSELPPNEVSVNELVADKKLFFPIPDDWQVVMTDIKGSTQAVKDGLHQVVNLVATGSIIAGLNIARKSNTTIPFFFGGDGATLLVPASLVDQIIRALYEHRENTSKNFGLELRVGHISVAKIYQKKHRLIIAKVKMGEKFFIPVILGAGLRYAEQVLKEDGLVLNLPKTKAGAILDLDGMECRWDKVKPPKNLFEVVCLLVVVRNDEQQSVFYKKVLDRIDEIYGKQQARNPISTGRLKLQATLGRMNIEMRVKQGKFALWYLIENWLITLFGKLYFRYDKGGKYYLKRLVELSDTLTIDGKISTVITGTVQQRELLIASLNQMEQAGEIIFGWHTNKESVISCYVRDRIDQHIHFVDGSEGGYTRAAGMLKKKALKLANLPMS